MCEFTFTVLDCGHRGEDHIDTSSCSYFKATGLHCQDDNPQHRGRGTTIEVRTKRGPGNCAQCFREEKDLVDRALVESRLAYEREQRARLEAERAREEARQRLKRQEEEAKRGREEALRRQKREEDEERASNAERARLARDRLRLDQLEAEEKAQQLKKEAERRASAAQKRRQEEAAKLRQEKTEARLAEARRQQELAEAREQMEREKELKRERKRQEDARKEAERREAEHQAALRRLKEEADRELADELEAERQRAADEQLQRERAELERRRKELFDQQEALRRAAREAEKKEKDAQRAKKLAQEKAEIEAVERENAELQRKLAHRRVISESVSNPSPTTEPTAQSARPISSSTAVDYGAVIGHHGPQEIGHGMLGGRRIPVHESQKRPEAPKTPISPPIKRGPASITRLGGIIASSPHDYKIQQPSLASTPNTPMPDWKKNIRTGSISKNNPNPESPGATSELEARLAKRRTWEAEQEKPDAGPSGQTQREPGWGWEMANSPSSLPSNPTSPALQTRASSTSPPPTYPVVPPLAHPQIPSAKPSASTRPPVPIKRISSTSVPTNTPSIPVPPPMPPLPTRLRVDSAAPSPQVGVKEQEWDDESESDEDRWTVRKQISPDDVFGEQRRKGWKAM